MTALQPGFANPVLDSQACFRAILDAMARPGTIQTLAAPAAPPAPLAHATAAALLTLIDLDTPLWLDDAASAAAPWIAFHCGAPLTSLDSASFAIALAPLPLHRLHAGSDEAPESAATLIVQLAALGSGRPYRLEGPGLAAPATLHADGLPHDFAAQWAANHARFPRGIDLILCAGDRLAALPRTLMIGDA